MRKIKITFSECAHNGDLDGYAADIIKCGGKIISSVIDSEAEMGFIIAEVPFVTFDADFEQEFEQTDSYGFVEFYSYL